MAMVAALACAGGVTAASPPPADESATDLDVPPVACWWQADRGAIRVGERFVLTLTCAAVATEAARAELEESGLAASSLRLTPFDVLDGERSQDVVRPPWRFLQYRYTLRVIGEDLFGKDVALPRLQVSYRVSAALDGGSLLAGRQQVYWLPPLPIRVLSLVPREATDIMDAERRPFTEVDARRYRAHLLLIGAAVGLGSAALVVAVLAALALRRRLTIRAAGVPVVSISKVLRAAARELRTVEAAAAAGWSPELAGRAAAALRLAGAVALGRRIAQREPPSTGAPREGELLVRRGRRHPAMVLSAAVTPSTTPTAEAAPADRLAWDGLRKALALVGAARYRRAGELDPLVLGSAVADAQRQVVALRRQHLWRRLWRRPTQQSDERTTPVWAR